MWEFRDTVLSWHWRHKHLQLNEIFLVFYHLVKCRVDKCLQGNQALDLRMVCFKIVDIHPLKQTWNPKSGGLLNASPFPRGIFRFQGRFRGCNLWKKKLYGTDFLAHMDQICVTTSLATVFSPSFLDELSIHKRFFLVEYSPQKKLKCQVTWDSPTKPLLFGGTVAGLRYGMPKLAFHILNLRKPSKKSEKKTTYEFLMWRF